MKNLFYLSNFTFSSLLVVITFSLSFSIGCTSKSADSITPEKVINTTEIKDSIKVLITKFRETESAQNIPAHQALFSSEKVNLNMVLMNGGNPRFHSFNRDSWTGFISSWDYQYTIEYSEPIFNLVGKNIVTTSHTFKGQKDGNPLRSGNDIFSFVKTEKGWEIINLTSTIFDEGDSFNYNTLPSISNTTTSIIKQLGTGLSTQETSLYNKSLIKATIPFLYSKDGEIEETATAKSFFEDNQKTGNSLTFSEIESTIYDKLSAINTATFTLTKKDGSIETGKSIIVLHATPNSGWKISTILFSDEK